MKQPEPKGPLVLDMTDMAPISAAQNELDDGGETPTPTQADTQ